MIVLLDANNYFTGTYASVGGIVGGIQVNSLPSDLSDNKSNAWRYEPHEEEKPNPDYIEPTEGETTDIPKTIKVPVEWVFDEERYKNILAEIKAEEERQASIMTNEELTESVNDLGDVFIETSKGEML